MFSRTAVSLIAWKLWNSNVAIIFFFFVSTYRAASPIGRKWRHRHRGPDVTLFQRVSVLGVYVMLETALEQCYVIILISNYVGILAVLLSSFSFTKL